MSDTTAAVVVEEAAQEPEAPRVPALPIRSRFLFIDVAAQRAKQLRRGATARVDMPDAHKLERVAMQEVRSGCIDWNLPSFKGITPEEGV